MSLSAGTRLGPYEVTGKIGAGGMGEVYRATDSKLGREVAIKTLPAALASDEDRLARFEREAKLLASLNHPHIASVHSLDEHDGTLYLAMELVDGQTLEEILKRGVLPIDDALRLALQIAQALEAAHDKGVVHRDLKPGNIMVTADGQVKVLDFGLAKAFATEPEEASPGRSPALSLAMTRQGLILGTAGYMSPEQASGQATDQRADIWAFGVVVYEMLTGLPVFSGESVPHILASVLKTDPDWSRLPERMHPRLKQMLERCLAKKPRVRYHAIADARVDIEEALGDPSGLTVRSETQIAPTPIRLVASVALAALIFGVLITVATVWLLRPIPDEISEDVIRLTQVLPAGEVFEQGGGTMPPVAISPDGRTLVYAVGNQIWKRTLESSESMPIPGTDGGSAPFFSPDGESIGFFALGRLRRIAIDGGGVSESLCDAPVGLGGSWGADETIYFAPLNTSGIWKVAASGGECEEVTTVDRENGEVSHRWPQALPDGKGVLFTVWNGPGDDEMHVDAQILAESGRRVLVPGGNTGRWTTSGHLVYGRAGVLTAIRFDLVSLETQGSAASLGIEVMDMEGLPYTISNNGRLAYVAETRRDRVLVWVDRSGATEILAEAEPRRYESATISPDAQKVAVTISGPTWDIWTFELGRPGLTLLAPGPGSSQFPVWTDDSEHIIYRGTREGFRNLYRFAVDRSGVEERLTDGENMKTAFQVSKDGQWLIYRETDPLTGGDLWMLSLDGESSPQALANEGFNESSAQLSPDGNWLAYASYRSNRSEIYLQPFPGTARGRLVSGIDGGALPRWSPSGDELFYLNGNKMMSVSFSTEPSLEIGTPVELYEGIFDPVVYDVTEDGRFLRIQPVQSQETANRIDVVINWFEELNRLLLAE